jgi:hypothetical protein
MNELDSLYCRLLHLGFIVLQQAADAQDFEWLNAEVEMLHNVPSLIGETNIKRHEYFWQSERTTYIERSRIMGNDLQISRMKTYYEPIWEKMGPLISSM